MQAASPPPPEANLAYKSKGEESSGVILMIAHLVNDVEKETQVMRLEEEDAQGDSWLMPRTSSQQIPRP